MLCSPPPSRDVEAWPGRWFSHLHGRGPGNLTLYSREAGGREVVLASLHGEDWGDINKWMRQEVSLYCWLRPNC